MRLALPVRAASGAAPRYGALAVTLLALAILVLPTSRRAPAPAAAEAVHPLQFFDEQGFAAALARVEASPPQPMPGARALIVPHHWLAGHLILGGLRDLAAGGDYRRVILIGPNHVNAGGTAVITSDLPWRTPFGLVRPDADTVRRLVAAGLAGVEPDVLTYEHSVAGIVPAVAYYLPGAQVIPLVLRHDVTAAETVRLARALAPLLDDSTVILAAVDFSHYLPAGEAVGRNGETLAALRSLDSARVLTFGDEHVDSPASIALVMESMRLLGAGWFELRADTNSAELQGGPGASVTSYISGYYR